MIYKAKGCIYILCKLEDTVFRLFWVAQMTDPLDGAFVYSQDCETLEFKYYQFSPCVDWFIH